MERTAKQTSSISRSSDIIFDIQRYGDQKTKLDSKVVPALDILMSLPVKHSISLGYPPLDIRSRKKIKYWNNNLYRVIAEYELEAQEARLIDGEKNETFELSIRALRALVQELVSSYSVSKSKEEIFEKLDRVTACEAKVRQLSERHYYVLRSVV